MVSANASAPSRSAKTSAKEDPTTAALSTPTISAAAALKLVITPRESSDTTPLATLSSTLL